MKFNYFISILEKRNEDFIIITNITSEIGKNINLNLTKHGDFYRGFVDSHFMKIYSIQKYLNENIAIITSNQIIIRPNSDENISLHEKLKSDYIFIYQDIALFNKKIELILNLYKKEDILNRLNNYKNIEMLFPEEESLVSLYNNIDLNILNISKSFSSKGQLIYYLDISKLLYKLNNKKVYPDPHVLRYVDMKTYFKTSNIHYHKTMKINDNIKKIFYILDIYEGYFSIKNFKISSNINNKYIQEICNFYNSPGSNYIYMPFSYFRYLMMNDYITELLIDEIYISTKIYPTFRNEYDYIDFCGYSKILKNYSQFYILMYFLENLKKVNMNEATNINITKINFKDNLFIIEDLSNIHNKDMFFNKIEFLLKNEVKMIDENPFS